MKKLLILFTILLASTSSYAGFPPMTDVNPNNIVPGQEVFIGYDPLQLPCLEPLPNFEGLTEFIAIDADNNIEITVSGLGVNPCLNIGVENPPYIYYSLGFLPEGQYSVQMYWTDTSTPLPVPPNLNRLPLGELISFGVFPPVFVPTLSLWALFLTITGFFMFSLLTLRKRLIRTSITMIFLLVSTGGFAKTFHIMLSNQSGAPSAEQLVNQAATSPLAQGFI